MAGKEMQSILEVLEDWKRTGRVPGGDLGLGASGAKVPTRGRSNTLGE